MNELKKILCTLLAIHILTVSVCFSAELPVNDLSLQDIALPSEIKDIGKQAGAIYYNTSTKNKALVPTHLWGEIQRPGLHFIPTDTTLIKGLSMAGGPTGTAKLNEVILSRQNLDGSIRQYEFNLSGGGDSDAHNFKMQAGDSIFLKRDTFYENRSYYTSWISIALSLITTFFIVTKVK